MTDNQCQLGIVISDSLKWTQAIAKACQNGRTSLHSIIGFDGKQSDINLVVNMKLGKNKSLFYIPFFMAAKPRQTSDKWML